MRGTVISNMIDELTGKINGLISEKIKDKEKALELQTEIEKEILKFEENLEKTEEISEKYIQEYTEESWLTKNWRPITMFMFVFLIVADWFGFSSSSIPLEIKEKMYSLMEISMGGYVAGRSLEKITKGFKSYLEIRKGENLY